MSDVARQGSSDEMASDDAAVTPAGIDPIRASVNEMPALSVAVTGGIGAGKSTVAAALAGRGAIVVDSDVLAREVVEPGTPGLAAVRMAFGDDVIAGDGGLDRAALAAIVFADKDARGQLEGITHPLVRRRYAEQLAAAPRDAVVVNDIPLIRDLAVAAGFQLVIGVGVEDDELRLRRLVDRGLAEKDARARITAQISDADRRRLCDVWLDNSGDVAELQTSLAPLWDRLMAFAANRRQRRTASQGSEPLLSDPDPRWPGKAVLLAARISQACAGARVDHIGSTAVPGFPAKNVIDLQLTVESLEQADDYESTLAAAGFPRLAGQWRDTPYPAGDDPSRWQKRLHGNADPGQTVNLHLRVKDSLG